MILNVMPLDEKILGFSNRWYPDALHAAVPVRLASGIALRTITPPYFVGTKIEAFQWKDFLVFADF